MMDFLNAALPWIAMSIAVAVAVVYMNAKK